MARTHWLTVAILLALAAACSGCSGDVTFAPVSGVVTLDGKPYGKAVVSFQPIGSPDDPNPGRGSSAYTDANGRFELVSDDHQGAVVGKHRVRIMSVGELPGGPSPEGGSSDETPINRPVDPIPPEWGALSEKTFDVPAGGTDKANFDILTKK